MTDTPIGLLPHVLRERGKNNSLHDINRAADFIDTALKAADRTPCGPTYYDEGKDAEWFETLDNKALGWELTKAAQDLNDSDCDHYAEYMPVHAMVALAGERLTALSTADRETALRDLIAEWRRRVMAIGRDTGTYRQCADELASLMDAAK